jgi:hypothetical protein
MHCISPSQGELLSINHLILCISIHLLTQFWELHTLASLHQTIWVKLLLLLLLLLLLSLSKSCGRATWDTKRSESSWRSCTCLSELRCAWAICTHRSELCLTKSSGRSSRTITASKPLRFGSGLPKLCLQLLLLLLLWLPYSKIW